MLSSKHYPWLPAMNLKTCLWNICNAKSLPIVNVVVLAFNVYAVDNDFFRHINIVLAGLDKYY